MYKVKNYCWLKNINLRGYFFTKKIKNKSKKHCLVFLRAPKHFNAGLHKVFFLKNYKKQIFYLKNFLINFKYFSRYLKFIFFYINFLYKISLSYNITSLSLNIQVKIKWCGK